MEKTTETTTLDDAIKGEAPHMPNPLPTTVKLQRGVVDPVSGEWHMTAEVRELTGEDEEYLASLESKQSITYAEYMTGLLRRGVVSIGPFKIADNPDIVEQLIIGDRDNLFLGIIKCTYGKEREFGTRCYACEAKNVITMDLDTDFPVQDPGIDLHEPIAVTLKNGTTVKMRLPNGADTAYAAKHGATTAQQNSIMIGRCLVLGDTGFASPEEWASKLSLPDRKKIIDALLDIKVGPQLKEVNAHCASCGVDMPIALNWVSLLLG